MKMPKNPSGVRYLGSTDYNKRVTIQNPNAGQAADGTPNVPIFVKKLWANVAQWRGKETEKPQERVGTSSYKIIIGYPRTFSVDGGMQILVGQQLHNIESFSDPDGQGRELHIWTFVTDDTVTAVS